jgi:PAS domain S-box-containing protein
MSPTPAAAAARALRRGAWQTKVGRRISLLFVVSALLPVTVLAVGAYRVAGGALQRTVRDEAQQSARRVGLMIFDRLDWADRELTALAQDPPDASPARTPRPADSVSPSARLDAVLLARPGGRLRLMRGTPFPIPALTARQSAHLAGGGTVLTVLPDSNGASVVLGRATSSPPGVVWGRVGRDVMDSLLFMEVPDPGDTRVCVFNLPAGAPVACQFSAAELAQDPLRPALGDTALGLLEWSAGGERYLAAFWSLFLDYRFAAPDWRIVFSHSRDAALAPLARFRQTFTLAALLAVLIVALLSTVQIRRSLDPLRALHEGTERVGRREFDQPVEIASRDEFQDLAHGFNHMAQRLKTQFGEAERLTVALQGVSEELRGREAQLRAVLESAADGIVVVGETGEIRSFNQAAERLFGYRREEAQGRRFVELFAVPLGEGPAGLAPTAGVGSPSMEVVARRQDGSTFAAELTFGRVELAGAARFTVFVRDIGDRKRAAEEQERLEAQLRQAQKMETIGTLAGGIAHDFNNILMPILGHLDLVLAAVGPGSELRSDLEPIRDAAHRARDLVKRILTFSRSTERAFGAVDLGRVVKEAGQLLRSTIPSTIAIRSHVAPDVPPVDGDGTQLHQVLMNLCTNAYHAMRERGGTLDLSLETAEPDPGLAALHPHLSGQRLVRLTVRDTGHGMDKATLERVFEPFFTTKPPGEGTGLGMSIVHGIVTGHRGAVTVESEPGVGTTFVIYLPPGTAATVAAAGARPVEMTRGHGHVLVVDDDEVVGRLVTRVLERVGYRVTRTTVPGDALELMLGGAYDLMITDQTMPGMTGTQLAQRVRARHPGFPIILMTGYSELSSESVERLGISEMLVKPVEIEPLAATVARVLQAARAATQSVKAPAAAGAPQHG